MAHLPKGQGVIPMPPFMSWLSNNVPAVYDNTMSYYEELCSLIKYLQDIVVPAVNHNAEALTTVSEALEQLKQYVDNYFANLDVQEEINNKLDQMAEDGTLQEIITAYIQANVAWTFNTVSDMKAATNLVAGSYAQTLGFHTLNDGGGATYYITDSGTANEMDVIAVGDLYANLVLHSVLAPEMLGAYGNGTTDDSNAMLRAISLADVKGGKSYKVTSEIALGGHNLTIHEFTGEVTISNNSDAGKPVRVEIDLADTLIIQNFKNSQFYFGKINTLDITATNSSNAFAYNSIHGGQIGSLYIYGNATTAWVNENIFYSTRVNSTLSIIGTGYHHNHNKFYDCVCENATAITLTGTNCNYFSFRGETYPTITVSNDTYTFGNVFDNDWYGYDGGYWSVSNEEKMVDNNIYRKADYTYLNDYLIYSAPVDNSTYTISLPQYTTLKSYIVDVDNGGAFRFNSDSATFRFRVTPLDSDNNTYENDPSAIISSGLVWDTTNKYYRQTSNNSKASFVINSKSNVSKLLVQIYNYATGTAHYVNLTYSGVRPKISEVSA